MEKGYTCRLCRPPGATPPHLDLNPPQISAVESCVDKFMVKARVEAEVVVKVRSLPAVKVSLPRHF